MFWSDEYAANANNTYKATVCPRDELMDGLHNLSSTSSREFNKRCSLLKQFVMHVVARRQDRGARLSPLCATEALMKCQLRRTGFLGERPEHAPRTGGNVTQTDRDSALIVE